jgi:hypothetical protein
MDVKREYKLTIAPLVSMRVFRRFFTDALSGPDRTMTGGAATAGSAFLFMVLTLKTNFSNNKGISQFAIFETTFSYRSAQGIFLYYSGEIIQGTLMLPGMPNLTEREVRQEKNRKVLRPGKHLRRTLMSSSRPHDRRCTMQ